MVSCLTFTTTRRKSFIFISLMRKLRSKDLPGLTERQPFSGSFLIYTSFLEEPSSVLLRASFFTLSSSYVATCHLPNRMAYSLRPELCWWSTLSPSSPKVRAGTWQVRETHCYCNMGSLGNPMEAINPFLTQTCTFICSFALQFQQGPSMEAC